MKDLQRENAQLKRAVAALTVEKLILKDIAREQGSSERRACQLRDQSRGTQRYQPTQRSDED